jgi:predicted metal-dependent TIM-barrel fold hydrolase
MILDHGFWTGLTLYPQTKTSAARAVDMLEIYGSERICVASACDWGPSLPTAIPHFILEMRRRGHSEQLISQIVYENPCLFLCQTPHFQLTTSPGGR